MFGRVVPGSPGYRNEDRHMFACATTWKTVESSTSWPSYPEIQNDIKNRTETWEGEARDTEMPAAHSLEDGINLFPNGRSKLSSFIRAKSYIIFYPIEDSFLKNKSLPIYLEQ